MRQEDTLQCFCDFLQKDCSEYFFIKVFAHETVYVLRGECARSLDSAGAYGGVPWLLSIMFPSPDFSEQRMEERMRENPIYLESWTIKAEHQRIDAFEL